MHVTPSASSSSSGRSTSWHLEPLGGASACDRCSACALLAAGASAALLLDWRSRRVGSCGCEEAAWPVYTRADVSRHNCAETGIWVTYKDSVYDITSFIVDHPGGDRIMLAAGKAIDPFWRLYQMHLSRGVALKMLEPMKIGMLDPQDVPAERDSHDDPYKCDPTERHPALVYHSTKPCNAELPGELILDNWVTPTSLWFIRHHHPVPVIDASKYCLVVEGLATKKVSLGLEDLVSRFKPVEVTATIQCGGNRRGEFNALEETSGISWGCGAMSTGVFKGPLLRDVLTFTGLLTPEIARNSGVKHVIFEGMDDMQASIPIEKALSPYGDVLLAYEMNGEMLPPEHGFPLRLVVPGHVGVRNVKWIKRIRTSDEEAVGPWQRGISYKGLSPSVKSVKDWTEEDLMRIQSIQEQPVTSMILEPKDGAVNELDDIFVKGFAYSGGGRGIVRVDVTADGGKTWHSAELKDGSQQHPTKAWAWTFWECEVPKPAGLKDGEKVEVCAKAIDVSYNTQPESIEHIWNLRGINNNSWSRVSIRHSE